MKSQLAFLIATFFGLGYSKIAPGTIGSLATLPVVFLLASFGGISAVIIGATAAFVLGAISVKEVLKSTPHDPSFVVIDEVAGQTLTFVPVAAYLQNHTDAWSIYLTGFILFRLFDISKPQPVGWADRKIINAWGVMLDDIIAGVYAMLILYILFIFGFII